MPAFIPSEYIKWVKRGLNRELGAGLRPNGSKSTRYREFVAIWQGFKKVTETGVVDPPTQNTLILANHDNDEYSEWVRMVLRKMGVDNSIAKSGKLTSSMRKFIRAYQGYNSAKGLSSDGWVGYYTEQQMIKDSGVIPPGEVIVPKKPKPPKIPTFGPPMSTKEKLKLFAEIVHAKTDSWDKTFPDPSERRQIRCVTWKLAHPNGIDFRYLTKTAVYSYANGKGTNTFAGGAIIEDITDNFFKEMLGRVRRNTAGTISERKERFQRDLLNEYREMVAGVNQMNAEYDGIWGDGKKGIAHVHRWYRRMYADKSTVLSCLKP